MEFAIIIGGALAYYAAYKFVVYLAEKSPIEDAQ